LGCPNDHLSVAPTSSPADQLKGVVVDDDVEEIELESEGRVSEFGRPNEKVGEV
jgi:hypothetical protein